MPSSTP
jgi:hypothetical protein